MIQKLLSEITTIYMAEVSMAEKFRRTKKDK